MPRFSKISLDWFDMHVAPLLFPVKVGFRQAEKFYFMAAEADPYFLRFLEVVMSRDTVYILKIDSKYVWLFWKQ